MAQLSLYLNDATAERLETAAETNGVSMSKFASTIINRFFDEERRSNAKKNRVLTELWNAAEGDETFVAPQNAPIDSPREALK